MINSKKCFSTKICYWSPLNGAHCFSSIRALSACLSRVTIFCMCCVVSHACITLAVTHFCFVHRHRCTSMHTNLVDQAGRSGGGGPVCVIVRLPSSVILCIELGGTSKWLPLGFGLISWRNAHTGPVERISVHFFSVMERETPPWHKAQEESYENKGLCME